MKNSSTKMLLFAAVLAGFTAKSQVKFPVTNNDLRTNLQKIITDFPHELSSLKGDTLADNPQTIEFASLLDFKGATDNSITQYKSVRPIYSWKATLLDTEDFEEASKKYNWLFAQLKVMTVRLDGGYSFTLSGDYDQPDESRKFSSSIFKLTPNAVNMPKLKIEASLQFEFPEWKVSLLVYEKEREDNERGETRDGK
ncbi:MAG TPA: hypothetical protein VNR87_16075 [Flavisolibacter sp.]|nr:hypothetical protein [Flavisolibacter sp.]